MKHIILKRQHFIVFFMLLIIPLFYNNCAKVASGSGEDTLSSNSAPLSEKALMGSQADLEGALEVHIEDDFKNQKFLTRHFLKTDSGERYELQLKKGQLAQQPGSKIRVKGAQSGDQVTLESSDDTSVVYLAAPAPGLSSIGEQRMAVLLVNFQDQPANKPWTLDQWNNFVFGTASGSVNNFYLENSYQKAWFAGAVHGWYTLPINSTDPCNTDNIANAAKAAASAAGVDLSGYTRFLFAFPNTSACSWGGMSSTGSIPSHSFSNGSIKPEVVAHELGHALGLMHSHGLDCDVSPIGNNCTYVEYGDRVDLMGWQLGHFNAFQKERLGWLNYNGSPAIITVQNSGNYVIEPLEAGGTNAKALKILKSTDPTTGVKTWYYLEYRQPLGVDYYFSTNSIYQPNNIFGGVLVRTGTDGDAWSSYSLDMTPGSLSYSATADLADPALVVGLSYTDSAAGVTIAPTSANSTSISVNITVPQSTCTRANPSVVMSPSQSSSVLAGTAVVYTVSVTNKDSSGCSSSSFNLQSVLPSGFTGTWMASSLSIAPGSSASTTLTVKSGSTAAAGTYNITSTATNSGASSYRGNASATYVIGTSTTKGKGRR